MLKAGRSSGSADFGTVLLLAKWLEVTGFTCLTFVLAQVTGFLQGILLEDIPKTGSFKLPSWEDLPKEVLAVSKYFQHQTFLLES